MFLFLNESLTLGRVSPNNSILTLIPFNSGLDCSLSTRLDFRIISNTASGSKTSLKSTRSITNRSSFFCIETPPNETFCPEGTLSKGFIEVSKGLIIPPLLLEAACSKGFIGRLLVIFGLLLVV